jgi:ribosomal small subunit protein bTHX
MGRGDKRSKRGKRTLGSFGVKRQARVQNKVLVNIGVANLDGKTDEATKAKASKVKEQKETKAKETKPKVTKAKKEE